MKSEKQKLHLEKLRLFHLGKHLSEKTKRKLSLLKMGDRNPSKRIEVRKKLSIAAKGRKHSEETKRKMSLARKGKTLSIDHRKNLSIAFKGRFPFWWKDKHHTDEAKEKIRLSNIGKILSEETKRKISVATSGPKSFNWKGGISKEPYGLMFDKRLKEQVRERDGFICQECGFSQKQLGYALSVHHIDYNKQNNRMDNLVSLCKSCHSKTGYNRRDWTRYYKRIISCTGG